MRLEALEYRTATRNNWQTDKPQFISRTCNSRWQRKSQQFCSKIQSALVWVDKKTQTSLRQTTVANTDQKQQNHCSSSLLITTTTTTTTTITTFHFCLTGSLCPSLAAFTMTRVWVREYPCAGYSKHDFACILIAAVHTDTSCIQVQVTGELHLYQQFLCRSRF